MSNNPKLIVRAKENNFLITGGKEYIVYNYYRSSEDGIVYYHLNHDSNMIGRFSSDNFIVVADLTQSK